MGVIDYMKKLLAGAPVNQTKEEGKMAEKMTTEQVNEYMKKQCGFVPRMFQGQHHAVQRVSWQPTRTWAQSRLC